MITYYDETGKALKKKPSFYPAYHSKSKEIDAAYLLVRNGVLYKPDLTEREKAKEGWKYVPVDNTILQVYLRYLETREENRYLIARRGI